MNSADCVLYSGGLRGAEAAFGAAAERAGIREVNFTFQGREPERSRGLRILGEAQLRQGEVSLHYVSQLMNRSYPNTEYIEKVLQTIWHQVNNAGELFVVGAILDDNTVMGGTGWGAEFAKLCNKPLYVFDQVRDSWQHWADGRWEEHTPKIHHPHFAGTGTRFLAENGERAIDELFARTFANE